MDIARRRDRLTYATTAYVVIGACFVLLFGYGLLALPIGADVAIPLLIASGGMAVGTTLLTVAAVIARRALLRQTDAEGATRAIRMTRWSRGLILVAAAAALLAALLLDLPVGDAGRSLGPWLASIIGAALAIFAAAADDIVRALRGHQTP